MAVASTRDQTNDGHVTIYVIIASGALPLLHYNPYLEDHPNHPHFPSLRQLDSHTRVPSVMCANWTTRAARFGLGSLFEINQLDMPH